MTDDKILYDKIYACWLGKNIGGTLGTPVEGRKEFMNLTWYPKLPEGIALPNDDLDLQLLNLHAAEQYGIDRLSAAEIAAEWREHVYFPWDEYGAALSAMRYGFVPPFSGGFDNHFTDCMGSPIRSEIWACICAGVPGAAAYFTHQDAIVDHAGGEGVWGEIFNAALEAAAFYSTDKEALIKGALAYIPQDCRVFGAVSYALELFRQGVSYREARERILEHHGRPNFTDAPQNIAFEAVGLLYGENFEDAILKTVNLGYDTDCTVATVGALLGIMYGRAYIPEKWSRPIGDAICVSSAIRGFRAPANLGELTERTMTLRAKVAAGGGDFVISPRGLCDMMPQIFTLPAGCRADEGVEFRLYYEGGDPSVLPGKPCNISVKIRNNTSWRWKMNIHVICPDGYEAGETGVIDVPAGGAGDFGFSVKALERGNRINRFEISVMRINDGAFWTEYRIPFTVLGANRWHLNGEETYLPGTTVCFGKSAADGKYTAEGVLYSPHGRDTQIMCASERPLAVWLDGVKVIDSPAPQVFMPAYHRAPGCQRVTLKLAEGEHKVRVELMSGQPPRFVFAATAPRTVGEPGNYFAYIDDWMI